MGNTSTMQHIKSVGTVYVIVSDQDAAIDFYTNKLGFELREDAAYGEGMRWVEVAPPGAETPIALVLPMSEDASPGGDMSFGYETDDLAAAIEGLRSNGVAIEDPLEIDADVPPMAYFSDPDSNRMLLIQRDHQA